MSIDTAFLRRCLDTLAHALDELKRSDPGDISYDIYRAACVKEFEIVLEQSGKLLRKRLTAFLPATFRRISWPSRTSSGTPPSTA